MDNSTNIKRIRIVSWMIAIVIFALFVLTIVNYQIFKTKLNEETAQYVESYGYGAVAITSFIVEVIPQPLVSALFIFASGLSLGMDYGKLLTFTMTGALVSNFVGWYIGTGLSRKYGPKIFGTEKYAQNIKYFEKYGRFGISILALTPLPYFPIMTGLFRMKFNDFIVFAIIPRIFHFVIFAYLLSIVF